MCGGIEEGDGGDEEGVLIENENNIKITMTRITFFLSLLLLYGCNSYAAELPLTPTHHNPLVSTLPPASEWATGSYVTYEQFGAVGDGATDDFAAIVAAHHFANAHGLRVRATSGNAYYIGNSVEVGSAIIQTDTDWTGATFRINDTDISVADRLHQIFRVMPSRDKIDLLEQVSSLRKGQERIDINLDFDAVIHAVDTNIKFNRKRFGSNQHWQTHDKTDVFRVNGNGYVDESTPILFDFDVLTSIYAYPIDEEILTIRGGKFITIARPHFVPRYWHRGIEIRRSNVVIEGIEREVIQSETPGEVAVYYAFFFITLSSDVTIRDSQFVGRTRGISGQLESSYELMLISTLNVSIVNVQQTNSITARQFWGIMAGSSNKNVLFDNVSTSRFDIHRQVHNATVLNSQIGYQGILVTGSGLLWVENTTVQHGSRFIEFREDWGSTWNGDVVVKNSTFIPTTNTNRLTIIYYQNNGRFDFAFDCFMPRKVVIDGLTVYHNPENPANAQIWMFNNQEFDGTNGSRTEKLMFRGINFEFRIPDFLRDRMEIVEW